MRFFLKNIILAGIYFAAAKFGLSLALVHASASPVWPPTGIAIAALFVLGYKVWPGVFVGAFAANFTTAGNIWTSLSIAAGNTLEGVVAVYFIYAFCNGKNVFDRPADIFRFTFFAGLVAPMVSATIGVGSLLAGSFASVSGAGAIWLTWWLGDVAGALVLTPCLIFWVEGVRIKLSRRQMIELAVLIPAIVLAGSALFGNLLPFFTAHPVLYYLPFPFLIWAALELTQREAATATVLLAGIAVWGTLNGLSPFLGRTENESLLHLQIFMIFNSVIVLAVSAVVAEHRRSLAALQELDTAKSDLITLASHQLRSPITVVRWSMERLKSNKDFSALNPSMKQYVSDISESNRKMAELVGALLDMSRLQLGKLRIEKQKVDLRGLIEEVLKELKPDSQEKELDFSVQYSAELPELITDKNLLHTIVQNVVTNAVQYTQNKGSVRIEADTVGDQCRIRVKDTGIGIAPADQLKVFTKFFRTETARTLVPNGTGVGLYLTKSLIERLGGSITFTSAPGQGTVFTMILPAK